MATNIKKKKKASRQFYIDNKEFYLKMCDFYDERQKDPTYRITPYIGECIMMICQRMSYSPNFIGYSFREEMVSDAIENCILYIHNFKKELTNKNDISKYTGVAKKSNPFSYFSQYAFNAFLRRIEKEKDVARLKSRYVQNIVNLDDMFGDSVIVSTQEHDSQNSANMAAMDTLQYYYNYESLNPKKRPKKKIKEKTNNSGVFTDAED